ncbi:hypothetical protein K488DRAFT_73534 [Vararia minispora EC-137]|uniref:Uncharacterized protein n=1 Tax=Vararia minispora EC-137 TaxID=1314806 RepID=A0ACB8QAQ2_9AGAM|nr:hypothetical protein K488DRAFT_73534 [Vararia minispora EC-137]
MPTNFLKTSLASVPTEGLVELYWGTADPYDTETTTSPARQDDGKAQELAQTIELTVCVIRTCDRSSQRQMARGQARGSLEDIGVAWPQSSPGRRVDGSERVRPSQTQTSTCRLSRFAFSKARLMTEALQPTLKEAQTLQGNPPREDQVPGTLKSFPSWTCG